VGTPLIARLPRESTICLTHESPLDEAAAPNTVTGDLTEPHLGLADDDYYALAREVDFVIHSAAATRFDTSREEYFAINRDGTSRVLEFAADARARVLHVSTAFVQAERKPPCGLIDPAGYIDSKAAAEEVVRASGLDWHMVRPSVIVEQARLGKASRRQGFHYFLRALANEDLPVLPSDDHSRLDFVAAELVADVLVAMVEAPPPGEVSFVTAGPAAWTTSQAVDAALKVFAEDGRDAGSPRIVAPEMVDRLLKPAFYPEMPRRLVRRFEQIDSIATVLLTPRPFESSLDALAAHYGRPFDLATDKVFRAAAKAFLATLPPQRVPAVATT
jgi:nucleoside-diphosphate-sugar epimerase